jgi:hypothetical protein
MGPIRNTEQQLDHIYYTRFCMSTTTLAAPFTNPGNLGNYVEPKSFSSPKPMHTRWIVFIQFFQFY